MINGRSLASLPVMGSMTTKRMLLICLSIFVSGSSAVKELMLCWDAYTRNRNSRPYLFVSGHAQANTDGRTERLAG